MTRILFEDIVLNKNPAQALDRIIQLPALRKYYNTLQSEKEKNDFRRHAAKYINIWLPDCAFEISFTNRYMVDQWEGKTTARKFIKAGEKIKYLCGELVGISLGEEDDERFIENAFSITYSSRRKTPSLFLGPARFSNHDCNANAKLESRGNEGMCVIAVRDIEVGMEINVHYGDNYFGEDNCECLCASCEKYGQGGWLYAAEGEGLRTPRAGSMEAADPGSRRSKRKRTMVDYNQRLREANTRMEEEEPSKRGRTELEYNGRAKERTPTPETRDLQSKPSRKMNKRSTIKAVTKPADARTAAMLAQLGRPVLPAKSSSIIKSEYEKSPHRNRWGSSEGPVSSGHVKPVKGYSRRSTSSAMERTSGKRLYNSPMLFAFLKRESFDDDHLYKPKQSPPPASNIPSIEMEVEVSQESTASSEEVSVFDVDHVERRSASPVTEPPSGEDSAAELEPTALYSAGIYTKDKIAGAKGTKFGSADIYDEDQIATPKKRARPPNPLLQKVVSPSARVSSITETPSDPPEHQKSIKSIIPTVMDESAGPIQPIAVTELTTTPTTDPMTPSTKKPTSSSSRNYPPTSPTLSSAVTAHRIPGDYLLTPRLLGPRNSRWVECRTCDDVFIQQDAQQTRRECPRCERHSKLYGFRWPQTDYDRTGDGNGPKRVMDHRTVNRFLSRAEEMEVSRKGRGCVSVVERKERIGGGSAAVGT